MVSRHELADDQWIKTGNLLPGKKEDPGRTAETTGSLPMQLFGYYDQVQDGRIYLKDMANTNQFINDFLVGLKGVFGKKISDF